MAAEPRGPEVSETHISTLFFTGDRAYKLLRPVRTSFLDHSTVEQRLQAVDAELALNRRMAPDVYLGSADVVERGQLVDRMLVMRRLPGDRRLTDLIERNAAIDDCVRSIARQVAVFHAAEPPAPDASDAAGVGAIAKNWHDNFADLAPLRQEVIPSDDFDRAAELADRYLECREALFQHRIDRGFVRDGHGDLTAQDIFCLEDGPRILDCLAFDRRLRVGDVLLDVAFLAMDLDRLAGPDTARSFLDWYGEFSNERHPTSLAHHYVAYRASVRAKVAAIRHGQGDPTAAARVLGYHRQCLGHLERGAVMLTIVGGLPGTGKSTLAQRLADPLEAMVLCTDDLRKDLAGRGHLDRDLSPVGTGIYGAEHTERTYRELLDRARTLLERGESVILDASWNRSAYREKARLLAADTAADFVELECVVDPETARDRIVARLERGTDSSDARPELLEQLRRQHEPWHSATRVNTTADPDAATAGVLNTEPMYIRRFGDSGSSR